MFLHAATSLRTRATAGGIKVGGVMKKKLRMGNMGELTA